MARSEFSKKYTHVRSDILPDRDKNCLVQIISIIDKTNDLYQSTDTQTENTCNGGTPCERSVENKNYLGRPLKRVTCF